MSKNVTEICNHIKIIEEWRGLKLFHRCKKCGATKFVGKMVYFDSLNDTGENNVYPEIENKSSTG